MAGQAGMFTVHQTVGHVLCCKCGIPMQPNAANMCVKCLRSEIDITEGAVLEQAYMVEYVVQDQMCESCSRVQANPDQWVAAVQLRQHVSHRRTFFYLEQLILKHDAAARAIRIMQMNHGIDFFFSNRSHAVKFVEFVQKVVPIKSRSDKQLVSQDQKSNTYNYKYTFSVEICPICREDLICLPPKLHTSLGNIGPIVLCTKVTNSIALLDPLTLQYCFLDAEQYYRTAFTSLMSSKQLVDTFIVKTHLGHLLNVGDHALGYEMHAANPNDMELDKYHGLQIQDVILVKKSYEEQRAKKSGKPHVDEEGWSTWEYEKFEEELGRLNLIEMRFNISLYRDKEYQPSEMGSMTDGEDAPQVPVHELLEDLKLSDEGEGMKE
ncbi:60S ribosomal export protein NMD3-like protein [Tanacetum coccineum]